MVETKTTARVVIRIGGIALTRFSRVSIVRDLRDIAGSFDVTCQDVARALQALPVNMDRPPYMKMLRAGLTCTVEIDGETVLDGYVDATFPSYTADGMGMRIVGRDRTGDLVDCAALPSGPAEFRGVDLLHVAQTVCAPFNISVHSETDIGAPFERLAVRPHETALQFLEGAARQRSVLLVSDGVGGLLLTRGGSSRAPDGLAFGTNIWAAQAEDSWRGRFSDYYVKGQTDHRSARAGRSPALDHDATPLADDAEDPAYEAVESSGVLMTGHAQDPEITRWRPTVRLTRSQSGMSSTQEQAEWMLRVARGQGESITYTVLDWRAGGSSALWRPNQISAVDDPYADIDKDMLIAGVTFTFDDKGEKTMLRVCGRTAFDRINEAERRRHRWRDRRPTAPGDSAPSPLRAP